MTSQDRAAEVGSDHELDENGAVDDDVIERAIAVRSVQAIIQLLISCTLRFGAQRVPRYTGCMLAQYATGSERLFAEYLELRKIRASYEELVGSNRPDFLLHLDGTDVVCEVSEITSSEFPQEGGAYDPYKLIRNKIHKKVKQADGAKGNHPFVIVIHMTESHTPPEISLPGAMFGDEGWGIYFQRDSEGKAHFHDFVPEFLSGGQLQEKQNTRISALAVLERFDPTDVAIAAMLTSQCPPGTGLAEHFRVLMKICEDPQFSSRISMPRLDVFHNPYAKVPLDLTAFGGPHDRQWHSESGRYRLAWTGPQYHMEVLHHH